MKALAANQGGGVRSGRHRHRQLPLRERRLRQRCLVLRCRSRRGVQRDRRCEWTHPIFDDCARSHPRHAERRRRGNPGRRPAACPSAADRDHCRRAEWTRKVSVHRGVRRTDDAGRRRSAARVPRGRPRPPNHANPVTRDRDEEIPDVARHQPQHVRQARSGSVRDDNAGRNRRSPEEAGQGAGRQSPELPDQQRRRDVRAHPPGLPGKGRWCHHQRRGVGRTTATASATRWPS